ncbi:hypothetical protein [uncultured Williamsia sp.]|uniref:hypothetical protein n=1 Tax=uncultured Williamsia sp. TaxID=259311 RepID=UPI002623D144|nr:hypothetical protein [uncultured Williamsia sp.]
MNADDRRGLARKKSGVTRRMASREAILGAAETLVVESRETGGSPTFVTVKQIAKRAKVSPSTVYNQFPGGVGAIALQLVDRRQAAGAPTDDDLLALARMEQARAMASGDPEASLRAELTFLYMREHADRARELMRTADSQRLGAEVRFLTRYAIAETIENALPDSRNEMLTLTAEAEELAEVHGAPHVERLIMRDHRVNALMAPVDDDIHDGAIEEAIALLRSSSEYIRHHQVSLTGYGWRYDAACRDLIAAGIEMREVDNELELRAFFADRLGELVDVLQQPREGNTGSAVLATAEVADAVVILEALDLIEQSDASKLLRQLDDLHPQSGEARHRILAYEGAVLASAILRGHKTRIDDLSNEELDALTVKTTATMIASLSLAAPPHDALWPGLICQHPRTINRVRFECFEPEFAIFENSEARRRLTALVDRHPPAPQGYTEIRAEVLDELEASARRAVESGQPLTPSARRRIRGVFNLVG